MFNWIKIQSINTQIAMKKTRIIQLVDLIIQFLLLAHVVTSIFASVFVNPGILFWSMLGLLPLGLWQLFSAFLLGFYLDDKLRRLYLITAVTFSSLFFSAGTVTDLLSEVIFFDFQVIAFIVAIFISFAASIYYFIYSYRYYRSGFNN